MSKIILLIIICGLLFAVAYFGWRWILTTTFRKKAKQGDQCKVYVGEEKHVAMIRKRISNQVVLELYEDATHLITRTYHINDIYPVW